MIDKNVVTLASEVSWDDDTIQAASQSLRRKFERLKFEAGKTYRVLILDENPVRVHQHYKKEFGYIRCLSHMNQRCAACDAGDNPAQKFGVNVLLYPSGVDKPAGVTQDNIKVVAWLFGNKPYAELRGIKAEWGSLTAYDLKITCTNTDFQHITITPCRDAMVTQSPSALNISQKMSAELFDLKRMLGRSLTVEQLDDVWAGRISRDELFKKDDGSSPQPAHTTGMLNTSAPSAPAPTTQVPVALNFDALLNR